MLIDICLKFREDSLRGFQVTERTRFVTDRQTDGRPGKNNTSPNPEGGRHNRSRSTKGNHLYKLAKGRVFIQKEGIISIIFRAHW